MRYIVRLWIWSFVRESFHAGWSQYHSTMVSLKDDKNIANKTSKYYKYWLCYICNISTMQLENDFFYLRFVKICLFVWLLVCFWYNRNKLHNYCYYEKTFLSLIFRKRYFCTSFNSNFFFLFVCLFVLLFSVDVLVDVLLYLFSLYTLL